MQALFKKVGVDEVPFGDCISRNGRWLWAAYEEGKLVCLGATKEACKRRYQRLRAWYPPGAPKMLPSI